MFWSNTRTFFADFVKSDTPVQCFFLTFSWTSQLKHLLLRVCLEDCLPELLSEVGILGGRSMKKSKKHRAVAQAALGDCGDLATGSWIQYPGSRIRDPGSWILDRGSWIRILDPGSVIQDAGSRIMDRGSWIQDPGSRILAKNH